MCSLCVVGLQMCASAKGIIKGRVWQSGVAYVPQNMQMGPFAMGLSGCESPSAGAGTEPYVLILIFCDHLNCLPYATFSHLRSFI